MDPIWSIAVGVEQDIFLSRSESSENSDEDSVKAADC